MGELKRRSDLGPLCLAALVLALLMNSASAAQFVYDSNGRLAAMIAADGSSARYAYDAAGNITGIQRFASGALAVFGFMPDASAANQIVIQGIGFSSTPSSNTVSFNGVLATVIAASPNRLVVLVPSGASSGPISVTVGASTASSVDSFVVQDLPTIASFSPEMVNPGNLVTIAGAHFDPDLTAMTFWIGDARLPDSSVRSVTSATAVLEIPEVSSGRVALATSAGEATTTTELVVVPREIDLANVDSVVRLTPDSPEQASIDSPGRYAVAIFHTSNGDCPKAIQVTGVVPSETTLEYRLFDPSHQMIGEAGQITASQPSIQLPLALSLGTHTLALSGVDGAAIEATLTLQSCPSLSIDGPPVSETTIGPVEAVRYRFEAVAGQSLGLGVTGLTVDPSIPFIVGVRVLAPDGSLVASTQTCLVPACSVVLRNLEQAGRYTVFIEPLVPQALSFTLTLSSNVLAALTAGTPTAVNLTRPGQHASLTFTAEEGQTARVILSGISPPTPTTRADAFDSSNAIVATGSGSTSLGVSLISPPAGTYAIVVEPDQAGVKTFQAALAPAIRGSIALGGSGAAFATSLAGQEVELSFVGSAGQRIALALTDLVTNTASMAVVVIAPNGVRQSLACASQPAGCAMSIPALTQNGVYRVLVTPSITGTMSFTAWLSAEVSGALALNAPADVELSRPGQSGRFTFNGVVGQSLTYSLTNLTLSPSLPSGVAITVRRPQGAVLISSSCTPSPSGCALNLPNLPVTGAYTITVAAGNANGATTASFTHSLVSAGLSATQ